LASGIISLLVNSAFIFPLLIIIGGISGSFFSDNEEERKLGTDLIVNINPVKLLYFIGIFVLFALIGAIVNRTSPFSLPIRLFQNFYRNGIFIYGGGQVLIPYLYTEMVEMKHYLNPKEFLFGFGIQQAIPGPVFSFSSFVGARAMGNSGYGFGGQLVGSFLAMIGINAPGLILMLFILPFWNNLKKITRIQNALIGVNAVSVGFILAALLLLVHQVPLNGLSIIVIASTFLTLTYTKVPAPLLIALGLLLGMILWKLKWGFLV
jgi:chromate transporter